MKLPVFFIVLMTLKDYIINNIDSVEIFSEYLGISEDDIKMSINFKCKIKSPFHRDSDPSLSFRYYGSKLICRDFGSIEYSGDVFQIVAKCLNKDCSNPKDFVYVCKNIIDTMSEKKYGSKPFKKVDLNLISEPSDISIINSL